MRPLPTAAVCLILGTCTLLASCSLTDQPDLPSSLTGEAGSPTGAPEFDGSESLNGAGGGPCGGTARGGIALGGQGGERSSDDCNEEADK